jgi:acyl-CoA thioesterase FadM
MPRLKLELPAAFDVSTELRVRVTDLNYGGHLGNDALLGLIHEARVRYLARNGWSEMDVGGCGLIMASAEIVFKAEAFLGDLLKVAMAARDFRPTGFDLYYLLSNKADDRELARARTAMVFFDYAARKPCSAPKQFEALVRRGRVRP